jgi:hypothetical protein
MKLTNKTHLPQVFVNLVQRIVYSRGASDISISDVKDAPQKALLKKMYNDHITEDVADRYYAVMGSLMHKVLEVGVDEDENTITEERLFQEVNGWKISGAIDVQIIEEDGVILQDYKFVGVFSVILGEQPKPDWVKQLNCYAYLVRKAKGLKVKKLQIVAIYRDYKQNGAEQNSDYPKAPIEVIDLPLWTDEEQDRYMEERVLLHQQALKDNMEGKPIRPCSAEEMWAKDDKFAIMKEGRKRAIKLYDSKKEAEEALKNNDHDDYYLEERKGEPTFCLSYCLVSKYCDQHKEWRKDNGV